MNLTSAAVLEVKFACPHCLQHLACDPAYCGTRIQCPTCRQEMAVPDLVEFSPEREPTAPIPPRPSASRICDTPATHALPRPASIALQSWFWLFFLGPMILFFLGGGFEFRWLPLTALQVIFLSCALIAGLLIGKVASTSLAGMMIAGVLFSGLILAADVFVCYFGGCAMACSQSIANP